MLARVNCAEIYKTSLEAFADVETRMGEASETLAHLADALSHDPDTLGNLLVEMPSRSVLARLVEEWTVRRQDLLAAWDALPEALRRQTALPPFGAADRSRPLL